MPDRCPASLANTRNQAVLFQPDIKVVLSTDLKTLSLHIVSPGVQCNCNRGRDVADPPDQMYILITLGKLYMDISGGGAWSCQQSS